MEDREYLQSHPWISFDFESSKYSHEIWMMLGESRSKCEHLTNVPILPNIRSELMKLYLAKGINATTAIEGNTLSEKEVLEHINGILKLPTSKQYLQKEIDNMLILFNKIVNNYHNEDIKYISVEQIKEYNRSILGNLNLSEEVIPGDIRTHSVVVGNYRGAPFQDCTFLLEKMCNWLNTIEIPKGYEIPLGIIKSIIAHLYINWIHPFGDGNGRTARLVEFQLLVSSGVPIIAAHLLANHYNQTRSEYYRQLKIATSKRSMISFINYALVGLIDGLRQQIDIIQSHQWSALIKELIDKEFDKKEKSEVNKRRKQILMTLIDIESKNDGASFNFVPINNIINSNLFLAAKYLNVTHKDRAIKNDILELEKMDLIVKHKDGVSFNFYLLNNFASPAVKVIE
jgi:Fic family protein